MEWTPPKDIFEVHRGIELEEPLAEDDLRYVDTFRGRGDFTYNEIFKRLGLDIAQNRLLPPNKSYTLFCGHRGCGKSTELKRIARELNEPERFFVVFMDAAEALDTNNLQYPDVLMALAKGLFEKLQTDGISLDRTHFSKLNTWFDTRVETDKKIKEFAADIKAGASAEAGLPFLGKLFASLTTSFKSGSTHIEEIRRVIKDSYSQFADAFNSFIHAAEDKIGASGKGQKILFVADGTDRLDQDNSSRFFINDAHQLQLIESNFIYCAPISLLHKTPSVRQMFGDMILPMVMVAGEKGKRVDAGYEVMRELLLKRADSSLFDSDDTIDRIIEFSGGCPREMLRILDYAYIKAEGDKFDAKAVDKAIHKLAVEYDEFLTNDDYKILCSCDKGGQRGANDDSELALLFRLALLAYRKNGDAWRRPHPVVRLNERFRQCKEAGASKEKPRRSG